MLRRRLTWICLPLVVVGSALGLASRPCPEYRTFSGIYLDYRAVPLAGYIRGEICVGESCQPLQDWLTLGKVAPGRLRLDVPPATRSVRLRVTLSGYGDRQVEQAADVPLRPTYGAGRRCSPTGHSRSVIFQTGQLQVDGAAPAWK